MFEFITNPEERGQVGIGTLIVFIAMVLVAAIAAGVLINTAGFLQTQAEATGQESTDLVSERIDVTSEVGIVGDPATGVLNEVRLGVSGAPGADQIDLTQTTIQAVGPGGQQNLVFTSTPSGGSEVTQLSVPSISSGSGTINVGVSYTNIPAFDSGNSSQKLVVEYDAGGDGSIQETTQVTGGNLDSSSIEFGAASSGDGKITASPSKGDKVTFDLVNDDNGDSSVLQETVTQTVERTALTVGPVSNGATEFTVDINYDNIESIDDSDDTQKVKITYDPGGAGTTTTATADDITSGSVTITAIDGTASGNTEIDASGGTTAGEFDSEDIDIELTDGSNTIGTVTTLTVGSGSGIEISPTSDLKATAVLSNKVTDLGSNEFAVGSDGNFRSSAVLNEGKDYTILINPEVGALRDTDDSEAFGESDSATLDIVSPSGATTSVELRAPDLFNKNGEAVRL
ncbi:flagellin N-terminal-like domain-containing protein [Halorubrum ezzemoulense]|uniref:Flagellin n=1 Tax=Halorubrum ezzemoulense TaxID=337243 RepID=A0A238WYZ1_HALEZ|nr:flagellin N-terminal-like domain-containing protein [Halorubrum ezzemoulense]